MEKLGNFTKTGMRSGAHFAVMQAFSVKLADAAFAEAKIAAAVADFNNMLKKEDDALKMIQKSVYTSQISAADAKRGQLYGALRQAVNGLSCLPEENVLGQKARVVKQYVDTYRIDLDAQYDQETGLMDNFLGDVLGKGAPKAALDALGMTTIANDIKAANDQVKELIAVRSSERSSHATGALKAARRNTDQAYDRVRELINAYATLDDTGLYNSFISEWNSELRRVKQQIVGTSSKVSSSSSGSASQSVEAQLLQLIPAFEQSQGLVAGSLSYSGHTATLDGQTLYLFYVGGNSANYIWARVEGDGLVRVNYTAGPGMPGGAV